VSFLFLVQHGPARWTPGRKEFSMDIKKMKKKHKDMKRKAKDTKKHKDTRKKVDSGLPPLDPRAMEKYLVDTNRLLQEREFESPEEANAFLQDIINSGRPPPSPANLTPLEKAQDIMYEAWDSPGRKRADLARRALKISKDCADAYVLLAEETTRGPREAMSLYEQGVKAGERALGPEMFEEEEGCFWGILETRPYMRARAGLAQCLWNLDEQEQAIEHYADMLRLNPNDNQGIRYLLANCLLEIGADGELERLLNQYEDDGAATWLYSRALLMFRKEGETEAANECLAEALKENPFVPAYLLGKKRFPEHLPQYISLGDESEAVEYAYDAIKTWGKTDGALQWLREFLMDHDEGNWDPSPGEELDEFWAEEEDEEDARVEEEVRLPLKEFVSTDTTRVEIDDMADYGNIFFAIEWILMNHWKMYTIVDKDVRETYHRLLKDFDGHEEGTLGSTIAKSVKVALIYERDYNHKRYTLGEITSCLKHLMGILDNHKSPDGVGYLKWTTTFFEGEMPETEEDIRKYIKENES